MTKKELIKSQLEEMGFNVEIDKDGDMMINYQLKQIFVVFDNDEDKYVSILYPQFYSIRDNEDLITLAACNNVTRNIKLAKIFIDQTCKQVTASCDFFFYDEASLKYSLERSLKVLGVVRSTFMQTIAQMRN